MAMDSISMVVGALSAGAAAMAKDTVSLVVKDAYASLKELVLSKSKNRKATEDALVTVENRPELAERALEPIAMELGLANDPAVLSLARRLVELLRADPGDAKFVIRTSGTVQGQQIGDGGTQHNVFGAPTVKS